jgi:aerobic C4-dicarboxylate transport protein
MSIAIATTNVIGNRVATLVTAKICGEFDEDRSREAYAQLGKTEAEIEMAA